MSPARLAGNVLVALAVAAAVLGVLLGGGTAALRSASPQPNASAAPRSNASGTGRAQAWAGGCSDLPVFDAARALDARSRCVPAPISVSLDWASTLLACADTLKAQCRGQFVSAQLVLPAVGLAGVPECAALAPLNGTATLHCVAAVPGEAGNALFLSPVSVGGAGLSRPAALRTAASVCLPADARVAVLDWAGAASAVNATLGSCDPAVAAVSSSDGMLDAVARVEGTSRVALPMGYVIAVVCLFVLCMVAVGVGVALQVDAAAADDDDTLSDVSAISGKYRQGRKPTIVLPSNHTSSPLVRFGPTPTAGPLTPAANNARHTTLEGGSTIELGTSGNDDNNNGSDDASGLDDSFVPDRSTIANADDVLFSCDLEHAAQVTLIAMRFECDDPDSIDRDLASQWLEGALAAIKDVTKRDVRLCSIGPAAHAVLVFTHDTMHAVQACRAAMSLHADMLQCGAVEAPGMMSFGGDTGGLALSSSLRPFGLRLSVATGPALLSTQGSGSQSLSVTGSVATTAVRLLELQQHLKVADGSVLVSEATQRVAGRAAGTVFMPIDIVGAPQHATSEAGSDCALGLCAPCDVTQWAVEGTYAHSRRRALNAQSSSYVYTLHPPVSETPNWLVTSMKAGLKALASNDPDLAAATFGSLQKRSGAYVPAERRDELLDAAFDMKRQSTRGSDAADPDADTDAEPLLNHASRGAARAFPRSYLGWQLLKVDVHAEPAASGFVRDEVAPPSALARRSSLGNTSAMGTPRFGGSSLHNIPSTSFGEPMSPGAVRMLDRAVRFDADYLEEALAEVLERKLADEAERLRKEQEKATAALDAADDEADADDDGGGFALFAFVAPTDPDDDVDAQPDEVEPEEFTDRRGKKWRRSAKVLGTGAFGAVYLGMGSDGQIVAIKVIKISAKSAAECESVVKEIRLLVRLKHENLVQYVSSAVVGSYLLIVMEAVGGGSLFNVIQQYTVLPEKLIVSYARDILAGLRYLHSNGIVHRDVKPHNVLITHEGRCKLADFGCSCHVSFATANERSGDIAGTIVYMAPEACRGELHVRSDVWSFGVMLYQMQMHKLPYHPADTQLPHCILNKLGKTFTDGDDVYKPNVADAPIWMRSALQRALTINADDRPSADAMLRDAAMQ